MFGFRRSGIGHRKTNIEKRTSKNEKNEQYIR